MNRIFAGALMAAVALGGCSKSSDEGGRAGADTFRILVPNLATAVRQGEIGTVRVVVERGKAFEQGVTLDVKAGDGLTVDPDHATLKASDKNDIQLKVTTAKDAPIGQHKVVVKATPDKGDPTATDFTVDVVAR